MCILFCVMQAELYCDSVYTFCFLQFDGTIYTFGFGSDHDANLLEAISTQGGGVYYYIDSNEKVTIVILFIHFYQLICKIICFYLNRFLSHLLTVWVVC